MVFIENIFGEKLCSKCGSDKAGAFVLGEFLCGDCATKIIKDKDLAFCSYCGRYKHKKDIGKGGVCKHCHKEFFVICSECGESEIKRNSMISNTDGKTYCLDCYREKYFICDMCGSEHSVNNVFTLNNGRKVCEECFKEDKKRIIRDYHSMKKDNNYTFFKTDKDEDGCLYFGIELEVESNQDVDYNLNDAANRINKILNRDEEIVKFEYDGSLEHGFEMIFQPMTLNFIRSKRDVIDEAFRVLKNERFVSQDTETCGLHIHFNRNYKELKDIPLFINNLVFLSEYFKVELQKFCRRERNQYAYFFSDDFFNLSPLNYKKMTSIKNIRKVDSKYQVFNFLNPSTFEFRLPKGTLNIKTFLATTEFLDNFIFFANQKEVDLLGLTWKDIITRNIDEKPSLKDYIYNRDIFNSNTIVNFGAIDTIGELNKEEYKKVMDKATKKGARMDLTF